MFTYLGGRSSSFPCLCLDADEAFTLFPAEKPIFSVTFFNDLDIT